MTGFANPDGVIFDPTQLPPSTTITYGNYSDPPYRVRLRIITNSSSNFGPILIEPERTKQTEKERRLGFNERCAVMRGERVHERFNRSTPRAACFPKRHFGGRYNPLMKLHT